MQYYALDNREKVAEVVERLRQFDPKATQQLMQATTAGSQEKPS